MSDGPLQTEYEFTLPQGYVDGNGDLHKEGRMRLATAADEIEPLKDPRVQSNSSYLTIILLSRVVTQLGDVESINRHVIENLFVSDLEYLQDLYERINNQGANAVETACPECGEQFEVSVGSGTPITASADEVAGTTGVERNRPSGETTTAPGTSISNTGQDDIPGPEAPEPTERGDTGNPQG